MILAQPVIHVTKSCPYLTNIDSWKGYFTKILKWENNAYSNVPHWICPKLYDSSIICIKIRRNFAIIIWKHMQFCTMVQKNGKNKKVLWEHILGCIVFILPAKYCTILYAHQYWCLQQTSTVSQAFWYRFGTSWNTQTIWIVNPLSTVFFTEGVSSKTTLFENIQDECYCHFRKG